MNDSLGAFQSWVGILVFVILGGAPLLVLRNGPRSMHPPSRWQEKPVFTKDLEWTI